VVAATALFTLSARLLECANRRFRALNFSRAAAEEEEEENLRGGSSAPAASG